MSIKWVWITRGTRPKLCNLKWLEVSGVKNQFFFYTLMGQHFVSEKKSSGFVPCRWIVCQHQASTTMPLFVRWQNACLFSCENVRQHPSIPRFDVSRRKIQPNIDRGRKSQIPFVPSRLKVLECESIKVISYRGRINNGIFIRHVSRSPLWNHRITDEWAKIFWGKARKSEKSIIGTS